MKKDPFWAEFPDCMTFQQIKDVYVADFVNMDSIVNHNHHFIWGLRGSGKSMLLKYIEASCQANSVKELAKQQFASHPIIPIYVKVLPATIRSSELDIMGVDFAARLSEHILIMSISRQVFKIIRGFNDIDKVKLHDYAESVVKDCFGIGVERIIERADRDYDIKQNPIKWIDHICELDLTNLATIIGNSNKNLGSVNLDCVANYDSFFLPFLKITKELIGLDNLCFYILIDDAGNTYEFQQEVLNDWIARRDHNIVSFKIAAVRAEYITFNTRGNGTIQIGNDYDETCLDVVYLNTTKFKDKLKKVVRRRFNACGMSIDDVEKLYPMDSRTNKLIESETEKLRKEFEERPNELHEKFADYCSRRLMPRVYQAISDKKTKPVYSGFEVVVSVSSGIIRNFLKISKAMYDLAQPDEDGVIREIDPKIQNDVLCNFSKAFYLDIRKSTKPEEYKLLSSLENLIRAMGNYFRARLLMKDITEGRIFSFTINQTTLLDPKATRVLQLAEQKAYLLKSFYSGKDGYSGQEWYLFSRSLAPFFRLDPTALKGRVTFSADDIVFAIENPDEFVKMKIRNMKSDAEDVLKNQMSFDDYMNEEAEENDDEMF